MARHLSDAQRKAIFAKADKKNAQRKKAETGKYKKAAIGAITAAAAGGLAYASYKTKGKFKKPILKLSGLKASGLDYKKNLKDAKNLLFDYKKMSKSTLGAKKTSDELTKLEARLIRLATKIKKSKGSSGTKGKPGSNN